jgi:hypothetical protein
MTSPPVLVVVRTRDPHRQAEALRAALGLTLRGARVEVAIAEALGDAGLAVLPLLARRRPRSRPRWRAAPRDRARFGYPSGRRRRALAAALRGPGASQRSGREDRAPPGGRAPHAAARGGRGDWGVSPAHGAVRGGDRQPRPAARPPRP